MRFSEERALLIEIVPNETPSLPLLAKTSYITDEAKAAIKIFFLMIRYLLVIIN